MDSGFHRNDKYELPLSPSLIKEGEAAKTQGAFKSEVSFRGRTRVIGVSPKIKVPQRMGD
jgi:hypothetical protein